MSRSSFGKMATQYQGSSQLIIDEQYDLKGLNLVAPDQVMPEGESPNILNARMYAKTDGDSRVAIRTRKGTERFSTPVGEAANVQNVGSAVATAEISSTEWVAQPFTPSSTGALTRLEVDIKKQAGATGVVMVDIYTDVASAPGALIMQSSIKTSDITTSFQYLPAYYIDADSVTSGTQYWMVIYVQEGGSGNYELNLADATGAIRSTDGGTNYSALNDSVRYKTYTSTAGRVLGAYRWYPQNSNNRTLFAHETDIYQVPDNTGTPASIYSALYASADYVRFAQMNDLLYWVDGNSVCKQWDGTTVSSLTNSPLSPTHIITHQQRLFFVLEEDPTRVVFSDLNSPTSYASTNFFYVPSPKSPDHIAGWTVFQENLVIFTHETKHVLYGTDIGSFTRKEAVGTKGAISQEAIVTDRNYIYFMADDKQIYRYNGISDELISEKVEPELSAISDVSSVRLSMYNNQLRVYYGKNPDPDAQHMLLFDTVYKQWFKDEGRLVGGALEWYLDGNELIEFSSRVGALYYGERDYSDMGKPINFKYWTAYKMYTSGAAKDRVKKFRPVLRAASNAYYMMIGKDIDFQNSPDMRPYFVSGQGTTWGGGAVWGGGARWGSKRLVDNKAGMSRRGKHTQYRFEKEGVETPVELLGYIAAIKSGRAR